MSAGKKIEWSPASLTREQRLTYAAISRALAHLATLGEGEQHDVRGSWVFAIALERELRANTPTAEELAWAKQETNEPDAAHVARIMNRFGITKGTDVCRLLAEPRP